MEITFHHCIRRQRSYPLRVVGFITSVLFATSSASLAQEAPSEVEVIPKPTTVAVPADGLFFADVLVRGKPIFQVEGIEPSPPTEILVRELAYSTVNLEVRFWVNSRRLAFLEITSQAAQVIKEALMQAGIELPTEIYTLEFRNSLTGSLAVQTNPNTTLEHPNGQSSMEGEYFAK